MWTARSSQAGGHSRSAVMLWRALTQRGDVRAPAVVHLDAVARELHPHLCVYRAVKRHGCRRGVSQAKTKTLHCIPTVRVTLHCIPTARVGVTVDRQQLQPVRRTAATSPRSAASRSLHVVTEAAPRTGTLGLGSGHAFSSGAALCAAICAFIRSAHLSAGSTRLQ